MTETGTTSIYEPTTWSLTELLDDASQSRVSTRLAELEKCVAELEAARAELGPKLSRGRLLELLRLYETVTERSHVLSAYGSLWFSEDTQSEAALAYRNQLDRVLTELHNRILFFTLWWKDLDDETAAALAPIASDEPDFAHFLADLRRMKPFTLEERAEQIVNLKDTNGISAVLTLYSMLTNRLEFTLEIDGERQTLTRDGLMANIYSPNPELREAAYLEAFRVFGAEARILGQIYVNRVLDWHSENVGLRGFSSPIAARNVANDIPDTAVETLLEVCGRNAAVFQRYFKWKAAQLGVEKLRRFDLYAPIGGSDRRIEYPDAARMVLETFDRFEPRVGELARKVFEDDHIDSETRRGKKGGAFCATVLPSQTPWVLLNYTGKARDVATIAHELGHAIHSLLAADHSILTQHASLPLAETASVFAERLLVDRMLADGEPAVKRDLLASSLDDIYATVMRQAYFVRFEERAHQVILDGKTPDDLDRLYGDLLAEQFGDAVDVPEEFAREWISIPHIFHTPFYCYAYSFGQLLVLALYRRYGDEGPAFVPGYLRLLARGGAARPEKILAEAGVDMGDPGFWQGGFDVVEGLVDELERL